MLTSTYEKEQAELKAKIPDLENEIDSNVQQFSDLQTFIKKVKRITRVEELTPELLNEFIERIDVHAAIKSTDSDIKPLIFTTTELV